MPDQFDHLQSLPASAPSLKRFLIWKIGGILVGGIAGASLGGNAIVWMDDPQQVWHQLFPREGIIGAMGGVLLGGTLAGGHLGRVGLGLLLGTLFGITIWFIYGALIGLFLGFIIGVVTEFYDPIYDSNKEQENHSKV